RHVERRREPRLPLLEEVLEAGVGVLRPSEAGEHPHGPEPAAVHRRVDAARERVLAGPAQPLGLRAVGRVLGRVERLDGDAGKRLEPHVSLLTTHGLPPRTSRAMTSFWICDVPSYNCVIFASRK